MAESHKDAALIFLRLVARGQVSEAYEKYVGPGFRHHNPFFHGDAASLKEAMARSAAKHPDKVLHVHSAMQDGERVAVYSHVRQDPKDPGGAAVVHLFRFENDRIAEFWDVGQAVPEKPVNEYGMF